MRTESSSVSAAPEDQIPSQQLSSAARGPRFLVPALVGGVLVAIIAVVLAGLAGGVFVPDRISDPGPAVRWSLPMLVVLGELALAVTVGGLVAVVCILPKGASARKALVISSVAAGVWTLVAFGNLIVSFLNILGGQRSDAEFGPQLWSYISGTPLGRSLAVIVLVAALLSVLTLLVQTATGAAWVLALAGVPIGLISMTGHTAGAASHNVAMSAMFLHLLGAAVWIGTLAALALIQLRRGLAGTELSAAIARFSGLAFWAYAMVGISGVISAFIRIGTFSGLKTEYALIVGAKIVLTIMLGALGWLHRRNIVQRLERDSAAEPEQPEQSKIGARLFWRLTAVELLIMGAVSGVAASLGNSKPPVPDVPPEPSVATPSQIIMGELLPPPETTARWFTEWRWEVVTAFLACAAIVVYTGWYVKLRRRGDTWPIPRVLSWWVGLLTFIWVTSGGPATYGHILFSSHMIQHMVLVMVIPIFLVMAAPVTLALRGLPKRHDSSRGPREWILTLVQSKLGHFFAHPVVAAVNFAGSMTLFYYTDLFEWALRTHVGHIGMIVHFTLAGYLFVNALVGIDPGPERAGYPQRLLLLLATMAFHAFFGVTIMSSEALLVPEWFGLMGREWGPSAIADQQLGGGIAWGIGEIPTIALAIIVALRWSRADERVARQRDRRVDRTGDTEMDAYNEMLARLAEQDSGSSREG